ncbi:MAG: sporulation integral membrane protein YtvI [Clostridia bacterium]
MTEDYKTKGSLRVERRRAFLINFVFFALIIAIGYVVLKFLFWPLFPFLMAFVFAMVFQRPVHFVERKLKIGRGFPSVLLVLLILTVVLGVLTLLGALLVNQTRALFESLGERFVSLPQMLESLKATLGSALAFLPDSIEGTVVQSINRFLDGLIGGTASFDWSILAGPLEGAFNAAKQVPGAVLSVVVASVCCVFITIDFPRIRRFAYRQIPPEKRAVFSHTKRAVLSSFGKIAKAYLLILCITFLELLAGFKILSAVGLMSDTYIIVLALVIAVIDIIPVLGTGTVLIPWALYSLIVGNTWLGIGLAVVYVIITVIRQYIEPKLVSLQLGLPPFLTLIAMFFGLQLFGFIGLFLMPMFVMLIKMLSDNGTIHLWRTERDEREYAQEQNGSEGTEPAPGTDK